MKYKTSKKALVGSAVVMVFLMLIAKLLSAYWLGVVGFFVFMAGIIQGLIFYRCPYCHDELSLAGPVPTVCIK